MTMRHGIAPQKKTPSKRLDGDRFRHGVPRNTKSIGATAIVDSPSENINPPAP